MKIIKISETSIRMYQGPIGISCSGGADSSVLLYILMKYTSNPIHIFTCASKLKNYTSAVTTNKIIEKCIALTGNNNLFHHVQYVDEQTLENLFYEEQLKNINVLYTAITKAPPEIVTNTFENSIQDEERNPNTKNSFFDLNYKYYRPFCNIDKKEISNIYKELDLIDTLFPLTRSCESLTLTKGHCGECWWCEERKWAFGKL
jgi:tRNA(Ile)-lysidine synthase TilS/MesJ